MVVRLRFVIYLTRERALKSILEPRQGTTIKRSRKTGRLARMLELPLEVFTEVSTLAPHLSKKFSRNFIFPLQIASYMSPYDILQLARTSKSLRGIFMSKSSKHVWVAARTSMGIPDVDDFSEPYYADLLFSKRCHGEVLSAPFRSR